MLCVALLALSAAAPLIAPEPDASSSLPSGWAVLGPSPRDTKLELQFAVKQQRLDELHSLLMAVSDPDSPSYGKHASNAKIHELIAPRAADLATVRSFLDGHQITSSASGDFLTTVMTVAEAERLLDARYEEIEHAASGVRVHRCVRSNYKVPANVAAAIDFIAPTSHVPGVRTTKAHGEMEAEEEEPHGRSLFGPSGGKNNVPSTLRKLYSIGDDVVGMAPKNKMAVTAFLGQKYEKKALMKYYTTYCEPKGLTCGDGDPKLVGDATSGSPGVESMLDIEASTGVAGNVSAEFWGFGGKSPDNPKNEPFMKWLTTVDSTSDDDVPKIFSTSYGEDESSWSLSAATRLNSEFMKAGARGISLLYASGDEGANCKGGMFVPETPSSSPYVTAVGGTTKGSSYPTPGPDAEKAVGLSSGGFSSYWPMPSYQSDSGLVDAYLKSGSDIPPTSRGYNVSGRAYPDISAQATNFCVTPFGCGVAGTSCASPTASGVFALLNDLRLQKGKPVLGFLNPFIYKNAKAFNDITTGSSEGCGFSGGGWPAAKGWDAVTGVGTPNYEKLAEAVAKLK